MKKSKRDTADTRERIVAVASQLFLEKGLAETGIADVMKAAGLTQGGFYRHFESKDQLIAEANRAANARQFQFYDDAVAGMPPLRAMETIVHLYLHQVAGQGGATLCPLANLGSELRHADAHIRAVAMEGYQRLAGAFALMARQFDGADLADATGHANAAGMADAIVATIVGAVTLSQLAVDPAQAASILDNAEHTVRTLLHAHAQAQSPAEG